jgi:2,3-bisphosphoglycerate-independent phosphoglycerate mutase
LDASGTSVGLSWDEAGDSEVGHVTLGAGRVVYQYEQRINAAIRDGTFFENKTLLAALAHAAKNKSSIHFVGLLAERNAHASLEHLRALLASAARRDILARLDLFADGKDSRPRSLQKLLGEVPAENLASLMGRGYGMDRGRNWRMTERAFTALTDPSFPLAANLSQALTNYFEENLSEEFLPPFRLSPHPISEGDAVLFFNFRPDGMRQLAESFADPAFSRFPARRPANLFLCSLVPYEKLSLPALFGQEPLRGTLGEAISQKEASQLRVAESIKSAHITYFFNGYREAPYPGELRVIIPSAPSLRDEKKPELSAPRITERILEALPSGGFDFILANYANADVMAHTGNFSATAEAMRIVDKEMEKVAHAAEACGALLIITADHGNAERMVSPLSGQLETQHDANPVPAYFIYPPLAGKKFYNARMLLKETAGTLADIAPTICAHLELPKPPEMTGKNLLSYL